MKPLTLAALAAFVVAPGHLDRAGPPPSRSYLSLLPEGVEKRRFILACTGCHVLDGTIAFPGGKPRDLASWRERIASMHSRFGPGTGFPIIADPVPTDLLASWLATHLTTPPADEPIGSPDPRVTEYLLPAPQDLPHDLVVDPDGQVVITGMFTSRMYVLNPASGDIITEPIPVPQGNPRALHIDPDGTWWVLLGGPGQVARRSPLGLWTTHAVGMYGHSIARDTAGVWVNGHFTGHPSIIAHVNAASGNVTRAELPSATTPGVSPIPYELRTGPDGRVWMSELQGGRVIAYDPATGVHRAYDMPVSFSGPRRLDVARDGSVWIPLYAAGDVVELEPSSGRMTTHRLPDRDALPYVVRVDDARRVVWAATGAGDAIYRFDRGTGRWDRMLLPSRGALVRHLDVDARTGDLWVAYGASPGALAARIARVRWTG